MELPLEQEARNAFQFANLRGRPEDTIPHFSFQAQDVTNQPYKGTNCTAQALPIITHPSLLGGVWGLHHPSLSPIHLLNSTAHVPFVFFLLFPSLPSPDSPQIHRERSTARTLPAARRRAMVPPRTRMVASWAVAANFNDNAQERSDGWAVVLPVFFLVGDAAGRRVGAFATACAPVGAFRRHHSATSSNPPESQLPGFFCSFQDPSMPFRGNDIPLFGAARSTSYSRVERKIPVSTTPRPSNLKALE
jgi:hypothetical protein